MKVVSNMTDEGKKGGMKIAGAKNLLSGGGIEKKEKKNRKVLRKTVGCVRRARLLR